MKNDFKQYSNMVIAAENNTLPNKWKIYSPYS